MPDVVIHAEFGREVRQALPDNIRSVLEDAPWTFALFGPDVWFMYQPWKRREGRGRRMHTTRPGAFLMALADRAASLSSPDALFSYLAGFLCHYALDAAAHPYVVYKTEWETKLPRGHMSFEHSLDYRELLRTSRWNGRHPVTSSFLPRCRLPDPSVPISTQSSGRSTAGKTAGKASTRPGRASGSPTGSSKTRTGGSPASRA